MAECLQDRLMAGIDQRRESLIETTRDLIRIPTLNPPGENYREICDHLAARLAKSGFSAEFIRAEGALGDSDRYPRWNVICRHDGGGGGGECVHFNGHTDVVTVGDGWTRDPFAASVEGDRIYGRGACDMKGGLASAMIAAEAFIAACPGYRGAIEISGTADEETGGFGGVACLAEKGYFDPARVQHVIIPEPLNKDRICLGHRGVWWAEIETRGRIAHGSMPFLGDCAVRHMAAVLAEMEDSLFPALAARRTAMPVVPEGARQPTLNVNSIHGGLAEPEVDYTGLPSACVPDRCVITIDRRFLVEEDLDAVKAEITALLDRVAALRPDFSYQVRDLFEVHPVMADRDAPVVATIGAAIRDVMGIDPDFVVSPGTYDQKHIDRIGRLGNCIAYGPGVLELAHQPDEWIGIADMMDSARVMALGLARLFGETGRS